jgi:hypothetical protein
VLVGEQPHRAADVGPALDAVGAHPLLLATLVDDPRAAAMLAGAPGSARRLAGSLLVRSARGLAERLLSLPVPGGPRPAAADLGHQPAVPPPLSRRARHDWPSDPAGVVG